MTDFTTRQPAMLALLKDLVETESPSTDKAAVDRVGERVAAECRALGGDVEIVPQEITGNHIVARFPGDTSKAPILTLCHMDTVFPIGTLANMPFYTKEDKTYGPGVLDMKGGIVITLFALAALKEQGWQNRPVVALFTSDEEIGSDTSRGLIESLAKESGLVLCLESGMVDGALKTWRKGVGDFHIIVKGRAAHSGGAHAEGRNAIAEMALHIPAIQGLTDYEKGTTVNVGVIKGGIASNVVPDTCEVEGDMRVLMPSEADRVMAVLRSLIPQTPDTSITVRGGLNRPPMPFDAAMQATFERARQIGAEIGLALKASGTGGGSDANFVAPLGVPVLDGLGTIGEGYHSEREYIFTNSLAERAVLVEALMRRW